MTTSKGTPEPAHGDAAGSSAPSSAASSGAFSGAAEERLRRLFETIGAGVVMSDKDGRVVSANPAAERILGLSRSEIEGQTFATLQWHLVAPDGTPLEPSRMAGARAMAEKRAVSDVVMGVVHADESVTWISVNAAPLFDEAGDLDGVVGTFSDITEGRRTEEALRLATDRLALAARAGGVGVWDWVLTTDTLTWDDQMFALYGITRQHFVGAYQTWRAGVHPDDRVRGDAEIRMALEGEKDFDTEFRVVWPDGTVRVVRALAQVERDASGEPVRMIGTNWDITAQRREADELRETTALLSALLASIPDIVFFKDTEGVYLGCNPAFARFVGRDAADIVGRSDHDLFGKEEADFFRQQDAIMMAQGEPRHNEEWIEYPDGARVLLDTHKAPLRDPAGRVIGLLGVSFDITERRNAEEALRASEARLGDFAHSAADWLWEVDANGVYTYSSGRGVDFFGPARADVIGKTPFDFMPPEEAERVGALFAEIAANKAPIVDLENWNIGADGEGFCLLTNGVPLLDEAGNLIGYRGADKDITERKRTEEALRLATDRLELATRAGGVGVWDWDVASDTLTWDEQMFALYGIRREQFAGAYEAWQAGLHPADKQRGDDEIQAALRGEKEFDTELRSLWPDGSVHDIRALARVQRDAAGQATHMIGTNWDVTERRLAQDEVARLNAELAERVVTRTAQRDAFNRELEAFAYSAAHDLRTPLRAIEGFSELLVQDAAERLTPLELDHLERVRAATVRMARMIDDLTGLSAVSRRPLQRRPVDMSATAAEVAQELRAAEPERRVELVIEPGMTAVADQALVRLVFVHLLGNAWKFTSKHDAARIEVGTTVAGGAGGAGGGEERAFFVRDDGAGFDMTYAKRLFGAFQRFHSAGDFEGDGIGLATAQRLVLRHGGRVWAESAVEKGATFSFTLPEAEEVTD